MRLKPVAMILALVAVAGVSLSVSIKQKQVVIEDDEVNTAIIQLLSSDEATSQSAKARIKQIGYKAVPTLISVLKEILANVNYEDTSLEPSSLPSELKKLIGRASHMEQKNLKYYVVQLLGHLRSEESVSLLIKSMEPEERASSWVSMNVEMHALVKIGSPAVPKLIEAIETAEARMGAIKFDESVTLSTEAKQQIIDDYSFNAQARSILVLGKIGDPKALPFLEGLLNTPHNSRLTSYIEEAISKIKER